VTKFEEMERPKPQRKQNTYKANTCKAAHGIMLKKYTVTGNTGRYYDLTFNDCPLLNGKYLELLKSSGGFSAFYMRRHKCFLFKSVIYDCWTIASKLQSKSAFAFSPGSKHANLPSIGNMDFKYWDGKDVSWAETTVSFELNDETVEEWPDAYMVYCRYGGINGAYMKTNDEINDVPVYLNNEDNKYLYLSTVSSEFRWVIDNDKNPQLAFFRSSSTSNPSRDRPEDVKWNGVKIEEWYAAFSSNIFNNDDELEDSDNEECFADEEFPADHSSINLEDLNEEEINWVCAEKICSRHGNKPKLFSKIEPNDACQGAIGDCWLIAAISSVAEFPNFIENHVFGGNRKVSTDHKYTIKLYDLAERDWKNIEIDSRIPCKKNAKSEYIPVFAGTMDNEMYVLLLEKAFAKYAGSYGKLEGGFTSYAWMNMTGCEEQFIWMKNSSDNTWSPSLVNLETRQENPKDFQTCYTNEAPGYNEIDYDSFWDYLVSCDKKNYILSASIGGDVMERPRTDGLVERHAYSLISIKEINGNRLLQLRNPWGNSMEWNGDWSDSSSLWEENPDVHKALKNEDVDDGKFWMCFDDFNKVWESVYVSAMSMPVERCSHNRR